MAKKKKNLSLEELLEEAIVKEEDIPYEVPANWVWCKIKSIGQVVTGTTPSKNNIDYYGDKYPFFKPTDLEQGYNVYGAREYLSQSGIEKGRFIPKLSTLVTCIGATIGKSGFSRVDGSSNQQINAIIPYREISNEYVFWFINSPFMQESIISNSSSTTLPILNKSRFEELPVPIPPFAEQKHIVDIIESLFEKLDSAKELVQNALDSFENRKAAILHKAFTGELTAKWRDENGASLDEWERKSLKTVADFRAGYAFDSKKFADKGYQVLRMGNLYNGILDVNRNPVFYLQDDIDENILRKSKINSGDILLTLTGTKYKRDYGYAVLIETEKTFLLNQRIVSLTAKTVETKYLLNYLKTNLFRDVFFSNETGGVNQGNVSSKFVENISIPVPTKAEQKEIVRILDNLLENEQQAKELTDVIEKIDLIKKAILAQAFRGELGTNNPEDENALELLKKVLTESEGE